MMCIMESINWVAEATRNEVNEVLEEFGLPQLALTVSFFDVNGMMDRVIAGYQKEIRIQSIWGGIRNPAAVLHNKIRHELTNYDKVRDALTEAFHNGMDVDLYYAIREELVSLFCLLCDQIIETLPAEIDVWDKSRLVTIRGDKVRKAKRELPPPGNHPHRERTHHLRSRVIRRVADRPGRTGRPFPKALGQLTSSASSRCPSR